MRCRCCASAIASGVECDSMGGGRCSSDAGTGHDLAAQSQGQGEQRHAAHRRQNAPRTHGSQLEHEQADQIAAEHRHKRGHSQQRLVIVYTLNADATAVQSHARRRGVGVQRLHARTRTLAPRLVRQIRHQAVGDGPEEGQRHAEETSKRAAQHIATATRSARHIRLQQFDHRQHAGLQRARRRHHRRRPVLAFGGRQRCRQRLRLISAGGGVHCRRRRGRHRVRVVGERVGRRRPPPPHHRLAPTSQPREAYGTCFASSNSTGAMKPNVIRRDARAICFQGQSASEWPAASGNRNARERNRRRGMPRA
eukprot:ctg_468.g230